MTNTDSVQYYIIAFYLLDKRENVFRKLYFKGWVGERAPDLTSERGQALQLEDDKTLALTIAFLKIATSPYSKTLNVTKELL